jgi:prevent-host-death family protein
VEPPLAALYRDLYNDDVKTLPLTEARKDLSKIVDEVTNVHEHITITRQGKPAAVVMSADEFESWQETIEILDDPEAMAAIRRGLRDIKAGRVRPLEDVLKRLGV